MTDKQEQKEFGDDSCERGRPDDEHGGGRDKPFEIEVVYNGLPKSLEVTKDELISSVLQKAIAAFGNLPQPHTLALYDNAGNELKNEQQTVHEAKIKKGDRLLLRPSTVKAG
jgi:hypothetical protein